MTDAKNLVAVSQLTRPIIGIENRAAQEVFDIMCDRIRSGLFAVASASAPSGEGEEIARLRSAATEALRQIEKYAEFFCDEDFDPTVDLLRGALS